MPAPLYVKYDTKAGNHYLYDLGTGRIIRLDDEVDAVIDDYGTLTPKEIRRKYESLGKDQVETAIGEIERLREQGYLTDHRPDELCRIDQVVYDGKIRDLGEFWKNAGALLILGITEKCNLCCSYCCYSGKFPGQRTHGSKSMSLEVAQKAIRDFLDQENTGNGRWPITFYGGEPLLEKDLLIRCVEFAKEYGHSLGRTIQFGITTNGTLLDETVCDFLMENGFAIMISLDGPRAMHDRYRVFSSGMGSFDAVESNLKKFVARHPNYPKRGLNITLAPPFEFDETERFVERAFCEFPMSRIALVNPGIDFRFHDDPQASTRYGCYAATACKQNEIPMDSFRHFRPEDREKLLALWNECVENLATIGSTEARKRKPLSTFLFEGQLELYHRRVVRAQAPDWALFVPCLPGFTRRFCDVDGNYRVCERVDESEMYRLGTVEKGLDESKMDRTMEWRRHVGDCANCVSLKTCDLCYARIPHSDAASEGFDPYLDMTCQKSRETTRNLLVAYTEIMERNPKAFDRPVSSRATGFKSMRYVSLESRLSETVGKKVADESKTNKKIKIREPVHSNSR